MAKNFYYKESEIRPDDIYTNSRLRNAAFVKVIGAGFELPISNASFQATYNPNGTGRPAPILKNCLLYTSPSPRDRTRSRMPSSA